MKVFEDTLKTILSTCIIDRLKAFGVFLFVSQGRSATSFWVKIEEVLAKINQTIVLMVGWSKLHPNNQPQITRSCLVLR